MTPRKYRYGPGYQSGDIKIAFLPGNTNLSNVLYGGITLGHKPEARKYGLRHILKFEEDWNDDFHVYSMKWKQGTER